MLRLASCLVVVVLLVGVGELRADLLLHFPMDQVDGTGPHTTPDTSPSGMTGILMGAMTTTAEAGQIGNSLRFNGGDSHVEIPDALAGPLDAAFNEFSFSAWLKPSAASGIGSRLIAGKMGSSVNGRGWVLGMGDDGKVTLIYFASPHPPSEAHQERLDVAGEVLSPAEFRHLAVTYRSDDFVRIYVNGDLRAEATESVDDILSPWNASNRVPFAVGRRGDSSGVAWDGHIDDVGIWDEALS